MQGLAFTQHYANSKVAKAWIDKGRDKNQVTDLTPQNSKALGSHANSMKQPCQDHHAMAIIQGLS